MFVVSAPFLGVPAVAIFAALTSTPVLAACGASIGRELQGGDIEKI